MPRLLVADDRAADRAKVRKLLADLAGGPEGVAVAGLTIEEADGGAAAVDALADPPTLILTALSMPDVDGLAVVEAVHEKCPFVPVILLTEKGDEELAIKALKAGASSFVLKKGLKTNLRPTVLQMLAVAGEKRKEDRLARCHVRQHRVLDLPSDPDLIGPAVRLARRMVEETAAKPVDPGEVHCGPAGAEDGALGFDETDRLRIGVALEEAVTNAVYHGNLEMDSALRDESESRYYSLARERAVREPYRSRRVRVELTVARAGDPTDPAGPRPAAGEAPEPPPGPALRFYVEDEGRGFDPADLPDPTDPENLLKAHGRGLLLVRTFMDEVSHNDRGNAVTLIKRAGRPAE